MNLPTSSFVLLLALAAPVAYAAEDAFRPPATELYRSTMPNGSVLYGESPAPGAKSVRKVPTPPASTGTIVVTPEDRSRASRIPAETGGVAVLPQKDRPATQPAQAGSGTTYGSGPGSLPPPPSY